MYMHWLYVIMCAMDVGVFVLNMQTSSIISSFGDLGVCKVSLSDNIITLLMHQSMSWIIHHHGDADVHCRNGTHFTGLKYS